jgi:torulene dioxygenase
VKVELEVTGTIPDYAAGVLYRTGPGNYRLKMDSGRMFEADHWFDGLTTVHRFEIQNDGSSTRVFYNSRRTVDELVQLIRKTGKFKDFSFAQRQDPGQSMFKKVMSVFQGMARKDNGLAPSAQNIGVTVSPDMPGLSEPVAVGSHTSKVHTLTTKTDAGTYQRLDPETLEPTGVCRQTVLHPDLKGPLSAAHAKTCPQTGDFFNYNLELGGSKGAYRIFQVSASTGSTTILATIPAIGAYMHSLFITPSTVILCVWNAHYAKMGISLLLNRNILDSIAPFDASTPATWYVIDRTPTGRGLIATYTSPAFFAFHSINAFEQAGVSGGTDIVAEIATYEDLSILHRFYYDNLLPKDGTARSFKDEHPKCMPHLTRYRLPHVPLASETPALASSSPPRPVEIVFHLPSALSPELPTINPRLSTRPHRYVYGVRDSGAGAFFDGLVKVDTLLQTALYWKEDAQMAGEPIFVPKPVYDRMPGESYEIDEDEGVLLSVVLDGLEEKSYLLVLDAKTMKEVGRAKVGGVVGFGFHGAHVSQTGGVAAGD